MKDKLRKHKSRITQLEHQVSQKNSQIVALEDNISTVKHQLAVSSPHRVEALAVLLKLA